MLYPTAKASYMYVHIHDMYSASQLVRFGHMHTLHMLCNIKTKDFEWLYLASLAGLTATYKRKLTMLTAEFYDYYMLSGR